MAEKTNLTKESIIKEAKAEVAKDLADKYKSQYKAKLREREAARKVLRNIEVELEDLELRMEQELGG